MKILLVTFLLFQSALIFSQMGLKFGLVGGFTGAKSYKGFTEVYNTNNAAQLTKNLNPVRFVYGAELEADYFLDHMYAAAGMTWLFSESVAKFQNEALRHVDLNQNHFHGVLGYGDNYGLFEYAIAGGVSLRRSFLHSYVRYPNGDKNYLSGQVNSTYTAVGIGIPIMAHVATKLGTKYSVFAKVQLQFLGVYNFSYFRGTSTSLTLSAFDYFGYEVLEDNKNLIFELGLRRNF
jgi:hypothetical protein